VAQLIRPDPAGLGIVDSNLSLGKLPRKAACEARGCALGYDVKGVARVWHVVAADAPDVLYPAAWPMVWKRRLDPREHTLDANG
jgi:hypothetical protein